MFFRFLQQLYMYHLHDLSVVDKTAFLECVTDVYAYMCICHNLALLFQVICVLENLLY